MRSWHAGRGRVHEDCGMATIEFVEDRVERFVTEVCAVSVGEEDHTVAIEVVEGVGDFEEAAFDVGRR